MVRNYCFSDFMVLVGCTKPRVSDARSARIAWTTWLRLGFILSYCASLLMLQLDLKRDFGTTPSSTDEIPMRLGLCFPHLCGRCHLVSFCIIGSTLGWIRIPVCSMQGPYRCFATTKTLLCLLYLAVPACSWLLACLG